MNIKRIVVAGTISVLLLGLVGTSSALVWMHGKLRSLESECAQLEKRESPGSAAAKRRKRDASATAVGASIGNQYYEYTVKEDDDIVSIAIRFGLPPSRLMDINDLKSADEVIGGMVLKIPAAAAESSGTIWP